MFHCLIWIWISYSLISVSSVSSSPISIMSYSVIHDVVILSFFYIVIYVFCNIKIIFALKIQRNDAWLEECHDDCGRIFD